MFQFKEGTGDSRRKTYFPKVVIGQRMVDEGVYRLHGTFYLRPRHGVLAKFVSSFLEESRVPVFDCHVRRVASFGFRRLDLVKEIS